MIPILILAGGQSTRMRGRDKLLEPVDDRPLLRKVVEDALSVSRTVFVALPDAAAARLEALAGLDVTPLALPQAAEGLSGTLRAGVVALPDCPAFLILLADLPEITGADIAAVLAARKVYPDHLIWRGATPDGKPGHPILFDARLRPRFAELRGDDGGERIVRPLRAQTHLVPFDTPRARLDLDTPEDWAAWRAKKQGAP